MKYKHTHRPGFLLGAIDFCTAGIFFLFYMTFSVEKEINEILGKKVQHYWLAYLLGTFNFFVYQNPTRIPLPQIINKVEDELEK